MRSRIERLIDDHVGWKVYGDTGLSAASNHANGWRNSRSDDYWIGLWILYAKHQFHKFGRRHGPSVDPVWIRGQHIERQIASIFHGLQHFRLFRCEFQRELKFICHIATPVSGQQTVGIGIVLNREHSNAAEQCVSSCSIRGYRSFRFFSPKEDIDPCAGSGQTSEATYKSHLDCDGSHAFRQEFSRSGACAFGIQAFEEEWLSRLDFGFEQSSGEVLPAGYDESALRELIFFLLSHLTQIEIRPLNFAARLQIGGRKRNRFARWSRLFNGIRLIEPPDNHENRSAGHCQ
jgi:hypothetical protein